MLQCAPGYCLALPAAAAALSAAESVPQAATKGGREGHTTTMKHGHTAGGSGKGKERTHQDRRFRGIRLPIGEQLLLCRYWVFMQFRAMRLSKVLSLSAACKFYTSTLDR